MKLYRNHYVTSDGSEGYAFFRGKVEARLAWSAMQRQSGNAYIAPEQWRSQRIEFVNDKAGILALLEFCASHNDNG